MVFEFETVARTHVGRVRERNEDSFLARPEIGLWVVADGMGGHSRGDRASQLVTSTLAGIKAPETAKDLFRGVRDAILHCHDKLQCEQEDICGCTVVALLAFEDRIAFLWAGDSRIYRLRGGDFEQLTTDHNLAQDLVARGMDPREAANSPLSHRLTRAVGIPGPLELGADQDTIEADDIFFLCTDGITGELDDASIFRFLSGPQPEIGADQIVEATLSRGARDNLTFVTVRARVPCDLDLDTTIPKMRD